MCQCAKVFEFPAPLWRVIKRGSSVRWMCNCISHSFSFFFSSPSHHLIFLVAAVFWALSSLITAGGTGLQSQACQKHSNIWVCDISRRLCKYANSNGEYVTVHVCTLDIEYTDRLSWQHLLSAPWTLDSSFFLLTTLFKSLQPLCNGKWHCSYTYWLLGTDLMARKFCFVG